MTAKEASGIRIGRVIKGELTIARADDRDYDWCARVMAGSESWWPPLTAHFKGDDINCDVVATRVFDITKCLAFRK